MASVFHEGCIEVICGPMFAGKTEELLRKINRFKYAKIPVCVFKPQLDTRSKDEIYSRCGLKIFSYEIKESKEILETTKNWDKRTVIAIDECQFFDKGLIQIVEDLANQGYYIILSGLDKDSNAQPFGIMPELLSIADKVQKLTAICTVCGNNANFTYRNKHNNNDLILIGDSETYQARCRKHFKE